MRNDPEVRFRVQMGKGFKIDEIHIIGRPLALHRQWSLPPASQHEVDFMAAFVPPVPDVPSL